MISYVVKQNVKYLIVTRVFSRYGGVALVGGRNCMRRAKHYLRNGHKRHVDQLELDLGRSPGVY